MFNKKWSIVVLVVVVSTVLAACGAPAPEPETVEVVVTQIVEKEVAGETVVEEVEVVVTATPPPPEKEMRPNVLHWAFGYGDIPTLDPAVSEDTSSIQVVEEITVGLTRLDDQANLHPGMAQSWDISEDGRTYTFYLLEGVPWVRWNGEEVEQVLDDEGNVRYVTAYDFEYGTKRTGRPDTASPYAYVLGFAIEGFNELMNAEGWGEMSPEDQQALMDGVQVKALDDYTLEMTFNNNGVYNINIAGLWTCRAMPQWIIEEKGDRWFEPGFNQSYGPYALKEWVHDSYATIVKNPFWPGIESAAVPQIDEVEFYFLDAPAAFAEYEAGNLERSNVPLADLDRVRADPVLSEELYIAEDGCTYFYGYNTQKPPVDNVHMRRALSHAIDRLGLVENVTKGGQTPAQWFCRPGMTGCPTMEDHPDTGIKSDVEAAQAELQAYLDEMGYASVDEIPEIVLMYNTSEGHKRIAEAISEMWRETLGIEVTVTNQEWKVYLATLDTEGASPQVWRLGWCLDYPDANNWTYEVMACGGFDENATMWCNEEFTAMGEEAAVEPDPVKRQDMYAAMEDILCYEDAAIAPIYWYTTVEVTKPYVNRGYSSHGHQTFEFWSLDLEME
jgi:oligopeptide transport system substrate-binding protein